jgi:hypothetical protein
MRASAPDRPTRREGAQQHARFSLQHEAQQHAQVASESFDVGTQTVPGPKAGSPARSQRAGRYRLLGKGAPAGALLAAPARMRELARIDVAPRFVHSARYAAALSHAL